MTDVRVAAHYHDVLGEGPVWIGNESALYWVDVLGRKVRRLDVGSGRIDSWDMPEPIGFLVPRAGGRGFVAGLGSGFHTLALDPLELVAIGDPEPDCPGNRMNDGKVDPLGRVWAGTMKMEADEPTGALYRLDPDLAWTRVDDGYLVPNGPAIGRDPDVFHLADSPRRIIYRVTAHADGVDKQPFIRFEDDWGVPDGKTIDAEDCLWVAHWDGGRVSRFDADGRLMRSIALPASRITSCAFGGAALDRLFVTSASLDRGDEPLAGAVFEIDPGVAGLASHRFGG